MTTGTVVTKKDEGDFRRQLVFLVPTVSGRNAPVYQPIKTGTKP